MTRRLGLGTATGVAFLLAALATTRQPVVAQSAPSPGSSPALLFAADGMRPDLMERYAAAGAMPTYRALMASGVRGDNGLVQSFPPNTGVGWHTLATGTWPGEHGITNNTYFRTGESNFNNRTSFNAPGTLQADTLAAAAERAGKKVAQIFWTRGIDAGITGPTIDFATFFSTRGVLAAPINASEQAGAASFGISYQVASFAAASGWSNVPIGDPAAPPLETVLTVATIVAAENPMRLYDIYLYDSIVNGVAAYDHVVLVRSAAAKSGLFASVSLAVGDFREIKLTGADGLIGARAGQTAGFYTKLMALAPDLSSFKLYFTSVSRVKADCTAAVCSALPAGGAGEDRLEKYIADNLPTYIAADFAPLEARIVDEQTYVQQGRDLEKAYGDAVIDYVLGTLQPDTDLGLVGYGATDEFSHQFMALVTPADLDGASNPYYDDLEGNGTPDGRLAIREGYIRSVYAEADARLARTRGLMTGNPTTIATSDHGFAPTWWAVNAGKVLFDAGLQSPEQSSTCRAAAITNLAKSCWTGATAQIYVNTTLPAGTTYEQVRTSIINAFTNLSDPNYPGKQVVLKILKKEELRNVDGSDSLHPSRSGDVVVVLRPPYQFDAGTPGQTIAFAQFFGQHGYLPNTVNLRRNVNMHGVFVAGGPGVRKQDPAGGVRAIDLAPTVAYLLKIPGPQNARGRILYNLLSSPGSVKEMTIVGISDYHGQIVPLSETADNLPSPGVNPSYAIGGAAFLKPWFDVYRAEAPLGSITVAGGDSVGATPPISSFFGDTPTIELMNAMGFSADGLGNHNFDKGEGYLRSVLIPLANYPFVSANIVSGTSLTTPPQWAPSAVFNFSGGKLGVIGFSNPDIPSLIAPGALGPFVVGDAVAAVNNEAARLKSNGVGMIVALGHLGATAGTLISPSGPLIDFADQLNGVDAVIGDHTDFQVLTQLGGRFIVENRSKGIRFTRLRLVFDTSMKLVAYTTADFHKPWDIGVTPDPPIKTRLDQLNAQLAPILGTVIGNATRFIPRADACGNVVGRTCESLVGDVVADSMRTATGVEFAITNSGGLRADLTCPTTDNPNDFCPPYTPPPYPITRGQTLAVLPFGNVVVKLEINGAQLKAMLDNGVSTLPAANGRFPQISGLCFTYDISAPAGNRVLGAVRQAADGSCTGAPVDLTAASTYSLAANDFIAAGGDGYPNFSSTITTLDYMDQTLADYIAAAGTISPAIQGRIVCTTSGATACPVVVP